MKKESELKVKAGLRSKTIRVDYLARVEGEGSLFIKTKNGEVESVQFRIFEPPRFFEALLRGRRLEEAPDITSRICGICPIAYQTSSINAMEQALGVRVTPLIRTLRRLIFCGEWIESHMLHVHLLHAPDFLGYPDAFRMAQDHPLEIRRGLGIKKVGNQLMTVMGGREIHPINVRVGGFYKLPSKESLKKMVEPLKRARDAAVATVQWVSKFGFPEFEQDYEFVSLTHPEEYPIAEGRVISSRGKDLAVAEFPEFFVETQRPYTNALHCAFREGGNYLLGPPARCFLNWDRLSSTTREVAASVGFRPEDCRNLFKSIIVRGLETIHACDEALVIIDDYGSGSGLIGADSEAWVPFEPKSAVGHGCSEAPRGLLYHRYRVNERGLIEEADIVPPTSQNQKTIELDLFRLVKKWIHLPEEELTSLCERTIRNYDPCISCSTHFLRVSVRHE